MIDKITADRIKSAANIVEVVSDYVHLTRRGANYVGLCPFHNERTPSFSVSPKRNYCRCFSCKKGGSPIDFLMQKEGIGYREALLMLAKKYHIEVEERELTEEERARMSRREAMLVANKWAMEEMASNLTSTQEGRNVGLSYFYGRGVTDEAIRLYKLGYALDSFSALTDAARKKGISEEALREVGLTGIGNNGKPYERFRGRVIFPVFNPSGNVVAFGGRDLKGGPAKYVNSPESDLYKKSNELYGIFQAKNEIVRQDKCYLVEGYLDVIGMAIAGVRNVVASSGTALTDGQIAMIHRFTDKITLIYDGDNAGIHASLRGMDMLLSHKMQVSLVLLPDGHDPDSFAKTLSPERFQAYLKENEVDILRFKAQVLLKEAAQNPQSRIEAIKSMVTSLAHIADETARRVYIQECSRLLKVDEEFIARQTAEARRKVVADIRKSRLSQASDTDPQSETAQENTSASPELRDIPDSPGDESTESLRILPQDAVHLRKVEYEMLRELLRFGIMVFPNLDPDQQGRNCIFYVKDEIEADGIRFTVDAHRRMFEALQGLSGEFRQDAMQFREDLKKRLHDESQAEVDRIASGNLTMERIRQEEKKLSEYLERKRLEEEEDFMIDYPFTRLANDPDDDIRRLVSDMMADRTKLKNSPEASLPSGEGLEPDRIIAKAVLTWKDAILTSMLNMKMHELSEAGKNGDVEAQNRLQHELLALLGMRKQICTYIGERNIDPRIRRR